MISGKLGWDLNDNRKSIIYIDTMNPTDTITAFDKYLGERGLSLNAVVVGGASLGLLGIITRSTKDVDILQPKLPKKIIEISREFASYYTQNFGPLDKDWLNNGPADLVNDLPEGWQARLQIAFSGKAVVLHTLGRSDLLRSKLFALCDREIDLHDCLAIAPSKEELIEILPWLELRDANPDWPKHVRMVLANLGKRLGYVI